jgi:RNA polymerase sigma-70 factor (ECF subfamily)
MAKWMVSAAATNVAPVNMVPLRGENSRGDSERRLIERAQRGEEQAFATLFQFHKKLVYSVCLQMTRNVADAEDLTQESFLRVFRSINSFRGDSSFSSWLYRIAVNTVLMNLRRRRTPLVSLDESVSTGDFASLKRDVGKTDPRLNGAIDRIALHRATEKLPAGCRQIFDLHEVEGYQHCEIAQLLQCSIGNSKSQLHRAKAHMRNILSPKGKLLSQLSMGYHGREKPGTYIRSLAKNPISPTTGF